MVSKKAATSSRGSSFPFLARSVSISIWTTQVKRISMRDLHATPWPGDSLRYLSSSELILTAAGGLDRLRISSYRTALRAFLLLLVNMCKVGRGGEEEEHKD